MDIIEVTDLDSYGAEEVVSAFERLIPQLSSSNPPPSKETLAYIAASEASHLLLAVEDGHIYGSMTLVVFTIPTGIRAWIEDVVVDEASRGKGVGALLNQTAIDMARDMGATTIDLTSRPSREAANRLYKRLGFVERETNVYRYKFES